MGYLPDEMEFLKLQITENNATLIFEYKKARVYFIQEQLSKSASVSVNSDRMVLEEGIYNEWLSKEFKLEKEDLEEGKTGYAASVNIENVRYRIFGQLPKEEIKKIVEYLIF